MEWIIDALPPQGQESGIATHAELGLARRWVDALRRPLEAEDRLLDDWLGTGLPFRFHYGGGDSSVLLSQWPLQRGRPEGAVLEDEWEWRWSDPASGLKVRWQGKRFPDFPAVEWTVTFGNTGDTDLPVLEDIQAFDLTLSRTDAGKPFTLHGAWGGRSRPDDLLPFSWPVPTPEGGESVMLEGDNLSSNRHLPFFNLETPDGRGLIVAVGWSGDWRATIEAQGSRARIQAGFKEPHFVLRPGESIRSPRMLVMLWEGRRLHGQNLWRRLLYRHYVPPLRGQPQQPLVTTNAAFTYHGKGGFLSQTTEQNLAPLIAPFVKLGVELFVVDAGWYHEGPYHEWLGDWQVSRPKFPNGLRPLSDRLAKAEVDFGLWLVPELAGKKAAILREHPEWFYQVKPGWWDFLRLDLPEVRERLVSLFERLIFEEGVTCYRQDADRVIIEEPDARGSLADALRIQGLYALWDELFGRHPDLIREGCASGGRRIDLETLSRFHWHQKSDRWGDSPSDQCALYGANLFLPGGLMMLFTEAMDDYGLWSSFAGQLCLACHPLDEGFPVEQVKRQVALYKRVRPLLSGDFYPLTGCSLEEEWIGYQFHRVDLDQGVAFLFRRPSSGRSVLPKTDTYRVALRGLDTQRLYRLRAEHTGSDEMLSGALLAGGIDVTLEDAPGAALFLYEPAPM